MPVQVDGEPWIQAPGEVVILKSALKVCIRSCFFSRYIRGWIVCLEVLSFVGESLMKVSRDTLFLLVM